MDTTPQQLLAIAKKLLDELRSLNSKLTIVANGIQQQSEAISKAADSSKQNIDITPEVRAVLDIPESEQTRKRTADEQQQRYHNRNLLIGWLTLFSLVAYAIVTGFIYCATNKAANAAKDAAGEAKRSRESAERSGRLDQRAWVTVDNVSPETKAPWEISIVFKNTGRTPAKNFAIQLIGEPVTKGSKPTAPEYTYPGRGVIAPDGYFHLSGRMQYNRETTDLFVHGKITYDSVFGNTHWTQFCYRFVPKNASTPKGGFTPCDQGNEVDGNEP